MPSWLHLGTSAPSQPSSAAKCQDSRTHSYHRHADERPHRSPPLHGVPILAPHASPAQPRIDKSPRHARSHSHPFPSLFASGRRSERIAEPGLHNEAPEALEALDEPQMHSISPDSKNNLLSTNKGFPQRREIDLVVGKCATCDSTVRWPKHLETFRCTVCLMVNDLQPTAALSKETDPDGSRSVEVARNITAPSNSGSPKKGDN